MRLSMWWMKRANVCCIQLQHYVDTTHRPLLTHQQPQRWFPLRVISGDQHAEECAERCNHHREQEHGHGDVNRLPCRHQSLPRPSANKQVKGQVVQPTNEDDLPFGEQANHDVGVGMSLPSWMKMSSKFGSTAMV